jgi:hypothetical protein
MFRHALAKLQVFSYGKGKPRFTDAQLVFYQILLTEDENFNNLRVDFDFYKEWIGMPLDTALKKNQIERLESECLERIKERAEFC